MRREKVGENSRGVYWYYPAVDCTVFEDTSYSEPLYYAWRGTWEARDDADHSPAMDCPEECLLWIEHN